MSYETKMFWEWSKDVHCNHPNWLFQSYLRLWWTVYKLMCRRSWNLKMYLHVLDLYSVDYKLVKPVTVLWMISLTVFRWWLSRSCCSTCTMCRVVTSRGWRSRPAVYRPRRPPQRITDSRPDSDPRDIEAQEEYCRSFYQSSQLVENI